VLAAVAVLADSDTARRAGEALDRLAQAGVTAAIAGIGETALGEGWRAERAPAEGLAVRVQRAGESGERLLKLWLEPGEPGQRGVLAGGWTDPLEPKRLDKDRVRFLRLAGTGEAEPLERAQAIAALDALVRRAGELDLALSEGVALVLAQLRRAVGGADWPDFDVVAEPPR
jgi:hypothetical protein